MAKSKKSNKYRKRVSATTNPIPHNNQSGHDRSIEVRRLFTIFTKTVFQFTDYICTVATFSITTDLSSVEDGRRGII